MINKLLPLDTQFYKKPKTLKQVTKCFLTNAFIKISLVPCRQFSDTFVEHLFECSIKQKK